MTSKRDNKDEEFNFYEDLSHHSSFNNCAENNDFGIGNEMDNSLFNINPAIHPNINNPQNEYDIFEDDRFNNSLNFAQTISLNLNNSQNEDIQDNYSLIFHPSIGLNSNKPLNENDNNAFSISNNSPIFPSSFGLNTNNPLNENENFENNIQSDSLINYLNLNNSQIENDINENKRPNDSFNFELIDNLHVNNIQFENDKYKNEEIKKAKVSNSKTKERFNAYKAEDETKAKDIQKRNDYIKNFFKTYFNRFLKNHGNKVIQNSKLPKKFKKMKIMSLSRKSFSTITKNSDNYKFLSFKVKELFAYYNIKKCKGECSYQKRNKERIEAILKFIDESEDKSIYEEVKSFFNMTLEEAYVLFFQSEEFKEFQEDEKVITIDEEVKVVNGVSLREKYGFIQLIKSHPNEN